MAMAVEGLSQSGRSDKVSWSELPPLPVALGLGGAFSGTSNGVLIVAGGSNFLRPPWDGGMKRFHDDIYILEKTDDGVLRWLKAGQLPFEVSNGASATTSSGVLCLGGYNAQGDVSTVLHLRWDSKKRRIEVDQNYPSLPQPCSYLSATLSGEQVYVAGGKNDTHESGMNNFWRLDLSTATGPDAQWAILDSWPGVERFGAVLASHDNGSEKSVYLFSGKSGKNKYLRDSYAFDPSGKWTQRNDLPQPVMVAASANVGNDHIVVFSGSDGRDTDRIDELREAYEFSKDVWTYQLSTSSWALAGQMPFGVVTTNALWFEDKLVVPGGEIGPGRRTARVLAFEVSTIPE